MKLTQTRRPYKVWNADTREYIGTFSARGLCMMLVQRGNTNIDAALRKVNEAPGSAIDVSGLTVCLEGE